MQYTPRLPSLNQKKYTPETIPEEIINRLNLGHKGKITLSDIKDENLKNFIQKYSKNMRANIINNVGLFLYGPPGVGKSSATSIILKYAALNNYTGLFIDICSLITAIFNNDKIPFDGDQSMIERALSVNILAIDDLSKENNHPSVVSAFNTFMMQRSQLRYGITIITSNMSPVREEGLVQGVYNNELAQRYGNATWDLFKESTLYRKIEAGSFRDTIQKRFQDMYN